MPRRKIPTKAELIRLQKLYKTDEKIAERLGNVTPQLVAYWRRKKNIPKHSFPKFSREEIKELWERYGDDYRCGLELGISKAAFYNWRRRYGFMEKPAFLKLEQLELNLGGPHESRRRNYFGSQTIAQKILAEAAGLEKVETGQVVEAEPDMAMSPDNAVQVLEFFQELGLNFVWNSNRIVIPIDYRRANGNAPTAKSHRLIREFIKRQNIKYFYDFGEGLCHQIVVEKAHILPGQLALGTDEYATSYGCLGAFATGISPDEMAAVWATGKIWMMVPSTWKIIINGKVPTGVMVNDIMLFVAKKLKRGGAAYRSIEFYGTAISQMSVPERFTICNLAVELGAKAAMTPYDSVTRRYLTRRSNMPYRPALADKDAIYESTFEFNVNNLTPQVESTVSHGRIDSVSELEGAPINKVILGTSANGRFNDLRIAANILKGRKIHRDVRLFIYPASRSVYLEALKKGLVRALIEAGAVIMSPGLAVAFDDILAEGDKCLATFGGGSVDSSGLPPGDVYMVSPATAAASALKGVITDPAGYPR